MIEPSFGEAGCLTPEELQLATRNHGMPLEALRYPITPVGLHYLLIHYDIPALDPTVWTLTVDGAVRRPLRFTIDDLASRPDTTSIVATMECAGNGRAFHDPRPLSQPWLHEAVGTAEWRGVPVGAILDEAGVAEGVVQVVFTGADRGIEGGVEQHYQRALPLAEARRPEVLLAFAMNGAPLLPQHGAPLRLVVPGWYGMANVKWLTRLTLATEPFAGYQQERAYLMRAAVDDPGVPVSRIEPRALMAPPGIPDFFTRHRVVRAGACTLEGRAWSGWGPIAAVEVSVDGGAGWHQAVVDAPEGPWAWQRWSYQWQADTPGEHVLCCRAIDATGRAQADRPAWNVGGYAGAATHLVAVTVVS